MRVLGIETTSRRGTVALLDGGKAVSTRVHEAKAVHGEVMLPFIAELFDEAGWSRTSLDRIAVGTGPGSFTGIRVGLAIAKGIALGLGRPVLGIGSLRAMCRGVPDDIVGPRWAVLDGRREDLFLGVFGQRGEVVEGPRIVSRGTTEWLEPLASGHGVLVGEVHLLGALDSRIRLHRSALTDLPHAVATGLAAGEMDEDAAPAEPAYLRPIDAIRPPKVRSPLSSKQPR